jgi:hypothetical protein
LKRKSYFSILPILIGFALVLGFSVLSAKSFDHSGMYVGRTPDGPAYLLPKILQMYPLDLDAHPVYGKPAGFLNIDRTGHAKLDFQNIEVPSMKKLDSKSSKILGSFAGPSGEDENQAYYWTPPTFTARNEATNLLTEVLHIAR